MTVKEIHEAIKNGKRVNWHNSLYKVYREKERSGRLGEFDRSHETYLDGYILGIVCIDNGFGGHADLSELKDCYID